MKKWNIVYRRARAEIELHEHPTDSLLTCEECGETCAGDATAMADFVAEHTKGHAEQQTFEPGDDAE